MSKKLPDIDRLFKTALDKHTEPLPQTVWENITRYLDKRQTVTLQKRYNRLKRKFVTLLFITTTAGIYAVYDYVTMRKWSAGNKEVLQQLKKPATSSNQQKAITYQIGTITQQPVSTTSLANKKQHATTGPNVTSTTLLSRNNFFKTPYQFQLNSKSFDKKTSALLTSANAAKPSYFQELSAGPSTSATLQNADLTVLPKYGKPSLSYRIKPPFATTNAWERMHDSRVSLTLFFAPDIAFDPLNDHDKDDPPYVDETNREQYASSFHTGVFVNYGFSKNWSLQSGLQFSNFSTTIKPKTVFARTDNQGDVKYKLHVSAGDSYIEPKSGLVAGDSAQAFNAQTRLQYLSIPMQINYGLQKGAFRFTAGLGLAANFLIEGKLKTSIQNGGHIDDYENNISGLKPIHLNGLVSAGMEYRLTKKVWLDLTPTARLALHSINNELPVKSYQNFLSIATGLRTTL